MEKGKDKGKDIIREISQCKREIEIEISAAKVKKEFENTIQHFAQTAKIKGFRPGKVPVDIIKRNYQQEIKDSVVNNLIPDAVSNELRTHNVIPVGSPVVKDLSFEENQPIKFKAQFEIWPEFELPEYKNIEVSRKKLSVTANDVKLTLDDLQKRSAQYIPTEERGVVDGDYVVTEISSQDIVTNKSLPKDKVVILAGHPENEKTLNDNLLNLKVNQEKKFTINYPKDHKNKKLAGKEIAYSIKALSIKEKKLPSIDDDFAKELGEFQNLKELKTQLKKELLASKENIAKRELAEEVVKKVADKVTFELPELLVEEETMALVRRSLSSQPEQVQKALTKEDVEKLKEEMKNKAKRNLKNHLLLTKISEKEKLNVEDKDVEDEMLNVAKANNIPLEKAQENIRKDELRENLLLRKTVDFLVENAIIKET
ncbi:trigger factor [Acidobacteriota bacterium]